MTRKRYNDYIPRETAIRVVDSGRTREQMIEMLEAIPSRNIYDEEKDIIYIFKNGETIEGYLTAEQEKEYIKKNGIIKTIKRKGSI